MKYLISILIYIPGIISFLVLSLITIIATILFKPETYDPFVKLVCRLFVKVFFIKVKVVGIEKIDPKKSYIFTCNHVNIFDMFILNGYIPNFTRGIELDKHFKWPVWGPVIRRFGNIPISHSDPKSALVSLSKATEALKNNISIIILPEGHRTRDGKLRHFMKGPFYLAHQSKADIVPMALVGAYRINRVTSLVIRPGTVTFRFGDVISHQFYQQLSVRQLRDIVRAKTQQLLEE